MTTTILVIKNNINEIEKTLESIKNIGPIIIGDIGSTDGTRDICKKFTKNIFKINFNLNYSKIKNLLLNKIETDWSFYIYPGEILLSGEEYLLNTDHNQDMYRIMVINDDLLIKENRFWKTKTAEFRFPVFENLYPDLSKETLPIIVTGSYEITHKEECIARWEESEPFSEDCKYYKLINFLVNKEYDKFINYCDNFLFNANKSTPGYVLIKYYLSQILRRKSPGKSMQNIMDCIIQYPIMGEFWCLLGDIFYHQIREYDKAYIFYENALILGSRRLAEDNLPTEISKYHEYPKKMMEACQRAASILINNV